MRRDIWRYRQLVRCLRLRRAVSGRVEVSLRALASQFRVSERTIRRDLIALAEAGEAVPSQWRDRRINGL